MNQDFLLAHNHTQEISGQATLEFLMSFIVIIGFLLAFIIFALNMARGYLAHYSVYMASRSYMVWDNFAKNENTALGAAQSHVQNEVFGKFGVAKFIGVKKEDLVINTPIRIDQGMKYEYVGAYLEFLLPFQILPIFSSKVDTKYLTESFLGKEPLRGTCSKRVCESMKEASNNDIDCTSFSQLKHVTLFDNGC